MDFILIVLTVLFVTFLVKGTGAPWHVAVGCGVVVAAVCAGLVTWIKRTI